MKYIPFIRILKRICEYILMVDNLPSKHRIWVRIPLFASIYNIYNTFCRAIFQN